MDHILRKAPRCHKGNVCVSVLTALLLLSFRSLAQDCNETFFLSAETIKEGQQVTYTGGTIFGTEGKSFIVQKSGYATLKAGGRIELNAGFEVHAGGGLMALIEGCESEDPGENPVNVFPNPVDAELHVEAPYKVTEARLLDMSGVARIVQKEIYSTSFTLDLSKVESGLYILEVVGDKAVEKVRIEKK